LYFAERGGQVIRGGIAAPKKKVTPVVISKRDRGKEKYVTVIKGIEGFDIKPKEVASTIGKKFGTGASATKGPGGEPEIVVQGDLVYEVAEALQALFKIPEKAIIVRD
jgi:density-regulated protein DRP1